MTNQVMGFDREEDLRNDDDRIREAGVELERDLERKEVEKVSR